MLGLARDEQAAERDRCDDTRPSHIDATGIASHIGRRTVVTALYAAADLDLSDVARHVGHSHTKTTAGYVRDLGQRPQDTARRAAELLDPALGL